MDQRTSDRNVGATTEFERDVVELLLATMSQVAKEEREDVGTESVLSALVSGGSAGGSAIAPGMKAAGSLGGSIGCRGHPCGSVTTRGTARRKPRTTSGRSTHSGGRFGQEQAKRLRWKNRKKKEEGQQGIELPPMTGALRRRTRQRPEARARSACPRDLPQRGGHGDGHRRQRCPAGGPFPRDGNRSGLVGLQERITLLGGALNAGPRPEGGFVLSARIPARPDVPPVYVTSSDPMSDGAGSRPPLSTEVLTWPRLLGGGCAAMLVLLPIVGGTLALLIMAVLH
ncbi:hypothetical protein SHIRM173S_06034 [Streptomyces hirsutus]